MFRHLKPCITLDFILYSLYTVVPENAQYKVCCTGLSKEDPEPSHDCFDLQICGSLQYLNFKVVNFVGAEVSDYVSKFTI